MPDEETMICFCRDVTLGDLARYIKMKKIEQWQEIVDDTDFVCGDSCELCHEEGYNNDGFSLAMAVGMVKRGYI